MSSTPSRAARIKQALKDITPHPIWASLRRLRVRAQAVGNRRRVRDYLKRVEAYPPRVVEHSYGGRRLRLFLSDPTAEDWYDRDWPELPEFAILRARRLRSGATVLNLGAHQGLLALLLAHEIGESGRVVAVEAGRHNVTAAKRNLELNSCGHVEIVHAAIADRPGKVLFSALGNGGVVDGAEGIGADEVSATTVDNLAAEYGHPAVIYCDVEGFECRALAGAKEVLRDKPDCFIEVHGEEMLGKYGDSVEKLLGFFPEEQYSLQVKLGDTTPFQPLDRNAPPRNRVFMLAIAKE